jgi:sulfate adenylyltransferase
MRLADGSLWPMPITLDVSQEQAATLKLAQGVRITLRDPRDDNALAILTVSNVYTPNKSNEAVTVFGKEDRAHPAVAYLQDSVKELYVGGSVQAVSRPLYYDYVEQR